ncbi:GntR family transcriptional regulator [Pseudopelagicola sp. nBUS_20]|uniref:GntR family transcriptional regulator n=1 Tax=Pseudopelagicola sp. nBUS_20 TaxID=3395317 RepID=UPI003EBDE8B1
MESNRDLFLPEAWHRPGEGSRYLQLSRYIAAAINDGRLAEGYQLPPERDLAELGKVSRVTVRKAVNELVNARLVEQKQGSGSFVQNSAPRTEQSLSSLVSFTENMQARGRTSTSKILMRGLFVPTPDEMMTLGLSPHQKVARIERLRFADGTPMALELSSIPSDALPDPEEITTSLYAILRRTGLAPSRAIQRVSAINIQADRARLMGVAENTALLQISRTAFLDSGRPIEYTLGLYRPDIYDFVAEIRPDGAN